jgi:hypothetical protein
MIGMHDANDVLRYFCVQDMSLHTPPGRIRRNPMFIMAKDFGKAIRECDPTYAPVIVGIGLKEKQMEKLLRKAEGYFDHAEV